MSSPTLSSTPSPSPAQAEAQTKSADFATFVSNLSWTMLILSPILIALPPRKLDLYTFTLAGAFTASANQITKERTGVGIMGHMPFSKANFERMSPKALAFQEQMRSEKEQRRLLEEPGSAPVPSRRPTKLEEKAREIWMGGETDGWKERRLREEQEKIQEGEGYGSMILDQIWDVWNWGEKKTEKLKEMDEAVVRQRERETEAGRTLEYPKSEKE